MTLFISEDDLIQVNIDCMWKLKNILLVNRFFQDWFCLYLIGITLVLLQGLVTLHLCLRVFMFISPHLKKYKLHNDMGKKPGQKQWARPATGYAAVLSAEAPICNISTLVLFVQKQKRKKIRAAKEKKLDTVWERQYFMPYIKMRKQYYLANSL